MQAAFASQTFMYSIKTFAALSRCQQNAQFLYIVIFRLIFVLLFSLDNSFFLFLSLSVSPSLCMFFVHVYLPFTPNAIKIIFMSLTIHFRIHGKIVESIGMDVRRMVVTLCTILGNGTSSLLPSLFSSIDIQFNANR